MIPTHLDVPTIRASRGVVGSLVSALGALLAVLLVAPGAQAQDAPASRGIDGACPFAAQQLDRFVDVREGTHFEAINCISYYLIT